MPGLLDFFTNPTQEQNQGLLAAAAQMLKDSGPSLRPIGFGQIVGGAYEAYTGGVDAAKKRQLEQEHARQISMLTGLKIKDAQSDFDNQELVRERNKRIMQRLQGLQGPGSAASLGVGAASGQPNRAGVDTSYNGTPYTGNDGAEAYRAAERAGMSGYDPDKLNQVMALSRQGLGADQAAQTIFGTRQQPMASAMPGPAGSPRIGGPDWLQAYQQQSGLQLPAQSGAPAPGLGTQAAAGGANLTQSLVARLSREAQIRSEEGDLEGANKLLEHAAKFMPEVHKIEVGMDNGKPVNVITYKNGTQEVSRFGAKPNMKEMNLGGTSQWVDENLVTNGQTFKRTQSPDSIASNAVSMRGQNMSAATAMRGQDLTNARDKDRIKAPTEFQGKSAAFGLRATESDKVLRQLEGQGVTNTGLIKSFAEGAGEMVPFIGDKVGAAVGSGMNTLPRVLGGPNAQQQQVEQARRDFVNAVLRQESGAVISPTEFQNAARQYFPQPGDDPVVIAQKARNRQLAIQGLQANAGRAALTAPAASNGWSITKVP